MKYMIKSSYKNKAVWQKSYSPHGLVREAIGWIIKLCKIRHCFACRNQFTISRPNNLFCLFCFLVILVCFRILDDIRGVFLNKTFHNDISFCSCGLLAFHGLIIPPINRNVNSFSKIIMNQFHLVDEYNLI